MAAADGTEGGSGRIFKPLDDDTCVAALDLSGGRGQRKVESDDSYDGGQDAN